MSEIPAPTAGLPAESRLRCAVIGVGHMGSLHAQKYAGLAGWDLAAVVDINDGTADRVASLCQTIAMPDYRPLLGKVDAVSVAVPTSLHHTVARDFLDAGAHVLIEKPIAVTVEEADELIALARQRKRVLQIGHLERFNAALMAMDVARGQPRFIEATRLAPFNSRANDVSVVLDLMIHDIDLILDLVDSEVEQLDAVGAPVLTDGVDIANARLAFANGCVANVTASRVSLKVERKMRLFLPDSYLSIDLGNQVAQRQRKGKGEIQPGVPAVISENFAFESSDALATQIQHFADCIRRGKEPITSGTSGRRALATAAWIEELLGYD